MTTPAPTIADAQLILQQAAVDAATGARHGLALLLQFDSPPTLAQFERRHPPGSPDSEDVRTFLMSLETTAAFVRHGVLNEALVLDLFWMAGHWSRAEKIVKGWRKRLGSPGLYEHLEWLAARQT